MLPSLPVRITCVALTAVTVTMDEPPGAIDAGLAVMVTVGAGFGVTVTIEVAEVFPPAPVAETV